MVAGYEKLVQDPCTCHYIQTSVHKYTENEMIKPVLANGRAIAGFFNSSTIGKVSAPTLLSSQVLSFK